MTKAPTHVVALSGGKDSTALALRLAELEPGLDPVYFCTPTGNELYAEAAALEEQLGHTFRSPSRDTWPADLVQLGKAFDSGRKVRGEDRIDENEGEQACAICLK